MTVSDNYYIDAVVVRGESKTHSVSINQKTEDGCNFRCLSINREKYYSGIR